MIMISPRAANEHDRRRKSRRLATAFLLGALASGAEAAEPILLYPKNTLLLLVAPWCAPCYGELARLDDIAAAARPLQVRVLLVDDGIRARAMVRGVPSSHRWEPAADEMRRVRADLWTRTRGLPYTVVTDRHGKICAEQKGGLDPARTRALVERCRLSE
jgi:thiol-disulfide isomerase/thioredoxin